MSFEGGQQRVMRPGWERSGTPTGWRVLRNRVRECFTHGSVGGVGGNPGSYPAPNDEERGQPHVPTGTPLARSSSSVSFSFGGRRRMALTCYTGPEALEWLKEKAAAKGFALNRFGNKDEAICFVEQLYRLGASRVFVPDDAIRDYERLRREIGGASSDSLVVVLPSESAKREALLEFYQQEASSEGLDDQTPEQSIADGQYLFFWWD